MSSSGPTQIHDVLENVDHQRYIDWIDNRIVHNSRWVILAFLLATVVFTLGLGNISTETGTEQFTTGLPSEEALEDVEREFSSSFEVDTDDTTLIQDEQNVLSKPSMLRMLRLQDRIEERRSLRVESMDSVASLVARELDPEADTIDEQILTVERATPTEIDQAVRSLAASKDRFVVLLSDDFNPRAASASATLTVVTHGVPAGITEGAGQGGDSPLTSDQLRIRSIANDGTGDITVFGAGIISQENSAVLTDSLLVTVPAAFLLIVFFLIYAYRDLADLMLGVVSLVMAMVWTFGFLGLAGIAFSQLLITIPPLLLAVGIDFGIHAVNRYREERQTGKDIEQSMRITTDQLTVAFFIVTGTTVIGFLANLASALPPIRDFGLVAAIGIVFTFLIFGIFLPAAKVELDRLRDRFPIPTFSTRPLGSEESPLASVLQVGVVIAKRAPALFLVIVLVFSAVAGVYATGINTSFEQEDFLPPAETPDAYHELPEPFRPNEYTVTSSINFLEDNFATTDSDETIIYIEAPMTRGSALESIHHANENPPDSFVSEDRLARTQSIISVIRAQAARDPEFRRLVERNDVNDNGIPDQNLQEVYDYLLDSPARDRALEYIAADYRSAQVVYSVEADAPAWEVDADTRTLADRYRVTATATGGTVVFQAVAGRIQSSAVSGLAIALVGSALFLILVYLVLEGTATLGLVNMFPVAVTVVLVAGSMRALSVPFNALTATILAIVIGLGVDYSVHMIHRFVDEREERDLMPALERTVRGTGGALLGSMLTTVAGIGVLSLALFIAIQQFGIITALSVFYAFLTSVIVSPSVLVVWDHFVNGHRSVLPLFGIGTAPWQEPSPVLREVTLPDPDPAVVPETDTGRTVSQRDIDYNGGTVPTEREADTIGSAAEDTGSEGETVDGDGDPATDTEDGTDS